MRERAKRLERPRRVAAIALEEDRLVLAVGRASGGNLETLDFIEEKPSAGLRRGTIADAELFADALDHLVLSLERVSRSHRIERIVCGVHGPFLDIKYLTRTFELAPGGPITGGEVRRVLHETALRAAEERVLLQVMPWRFVLDEYRETTRPAGLRADRLRLEALGVYADRSPYADFQDVFGELGLSGTEMSLASLATAQAALTPEERARGVVLVELAWEACRVSVYSKNRLYLYRPTEAGLFTLAESLARLVRLTPIEARRMIPTLSVTDADDPLSVVARRFLASVLAEAKRFLGESLSVMGHPPAIVGWVLAGLLAEAEGADHVARREVDGEVRIARPPERFRIAGHDDSTCLPILGLLSSAAGGPSAPDPGIGRRAVSHVRGLPRKILRRMHPRV